QHSIKAGAITGMEELSGSVIEERRRLCTQFASVTSTDDAVAQCFLAENDWNLERAVHSFFETDVVLIPSAEPNTSKEHSVKNELETVACIDLTEDEPNDCASSSSGDANNANEQLGNKDNSSFSLLTWNIDGLDECEIIERARGVCSLIALYEPDIVFLQEVIPPYLGYLRKRAVSYTIVAGNDEFYFSAIMLKKSRVKLINKEIIDYPTTKMLRNLLTVKVSGNKPCCSCILYLMTSHLESTKDHSAERIKQLKTVLKKMNDIPDSAIVIFGGDTNLRDQEVTKTGGLPDNICDAWEFVGKPEHCRYTWDTTTNSNKQARYKCRLRFDRIFCRRTQSGMQVTPHDMDLIGLDKLDCGRFPSDHWGIICNFNI
uniref:Tyrosyl-DNA phosphodiesterase 2 n=1 Tax=Erpetoichthys calabaricus TaxID=27687 RepID=A0A8C4TE26_ERPCA